MIMSRTMFVGAVAIAASLLPMSASAQDNYVSFSAGAAMLDDSQNSGAFNSAFTTGQGTTIPSGTVLPSGTPVGWNTEFDAGYAISAAYGRYFGPIRGEIEVAHQTNDVDTHNGVQAGGISLGGEDAGVLISGSPALGVTVANLVADGRGSVEGTYLFANALYDFTALGAFTPYVGAGIGVAQVKVDYSPSGVGIVDDEDTVFAYQLIGGASYTLSDNTAVFAQARYRATEDVSTQVSLFGANLEVENSATLFEAGIRFRF